MKFSYTFLTLISSFSLFAQSQRDLTDPRLIIENARAQSKSTNRRSSLIVPDDDLIRIEQIGETKVELTPEQKEAKRKAEERARIEKERKHQAWLNEVVEPHKNYHKVGDDYSKVSYKQVLKFPEGNPIRNLVKNTVLVNHYIEERRGITDIGRGTAFYLGQINGKSLFMTNQHVMTAELCKDAKIQYLASNERSVRKAKCDEVLLELSPRQGADITIFTVKAEDLKSFDAQGLTIDFNSPLEAFTEVAHAGFGLKKDPSKHPNKLENFKNDFNAIFDKDCMIISESGKYFSDYGDRYNNKVKYSFRIGCDMARGDSGGAVIDRNTGDVIGIVWATAINDKRKEIQKEVSSKTLQLIAGTNDSRIFYNSSTAIYLSKHRDAIEYILKTGEPYVPVSYVKTTPVKVEGLPEIGEKVEEKKAVEKK